MILFKRNKQILEGQYKRTGQFDLKFNACLPCDLITECFNSISVPIKKCLFTTQNKKRYVDERIKFGFVLILFIDHCKTYHSHF